MVTLLKLEELGQLLLSILLFTQLNYSWWVFPACILLPDIAMLGYLLNSKTGAWVYNFFHHKLLGTLILCFGFYTDIDLMTLAGIILFGHSSLDRLFGYGLKYKTGFKHTHLSKIG